MQHKTSLWYVGDLVLVCYRLRISNAFYDTTEEQISAFEKREETLRASWSMELFKK